MIDLPDLLIFTPVSLSFCRHDGRSVERQRLIIDDMSAIGLVSAAAKVMRMTAHSINRLRERAHAESFTAALLGYSAVRRAAIVIWRNGDPHESAGLPLGVESGLPIVGSLARFGDP